MLQGRETRRTTPSVIDLVRHLTESVAGWNEHMKIFYDGMHVTDRGSVVYAEYIAERLRAEVLAGRFRKHKPQIYPTADGSATQEGH